MKKLFLLLVLVLNVVLLFSQQPSKVFKNLALEGYMDHLSYEPNDVADVFLSANQNVSNVTLYLNSIDNKVVDSVVCNVKPQKVSNDKPWENGFGYAVSFKYNVPELKSGIYHWGDSKICFIVKNKAKNAPITIVIPTNTSSAYNQAGGKSFYRPINHTAQVVSFLRPEVFGDLSVDTSHFQFCGSFLAWVNNTNYDYQVISDQDLDNYEEIKKTSILMIIGHSEYWTRKARYNFDCFSNSGGDAIILSGNTMWWQVRYSEDKTKLICFKNQALDTIKTQTLKTDRWDKAFLKYPISHSIGVDFNYGAYGTDVKLMSPFQGYKIIGEQSPLFEGVNLKYGDVLHCPTDEYDGTLISGLNANGDPIPNYDLLDFCKIEIIGYDKGNGTRVDNQGQFGYGTFIVFKKNAWSGNIINTSSTNWCGREGIGGQDSLLIRKITSNMIDKLLSKSNIFISELNSNCSMGEYDGDPTLSQKVHVFPIPTSDNVTMQFSEMKFEFIKIQLSDLSGKVVKTVELNLNFPSYEMDLSEISIGIYLLQIQTNSELISRKIVKN